MMAKPRCPEHDIQLVGSRTQFGRRMSCPRPGCTVACWGGRTSTPADDETRLLRQRCHAIFDPMWKPGGRFYSKRAAKYKRVGRAYAWLAKLMEMPASKCHFGMFNADQCREALRHLARMNGGDDDL